MVTPAGMAAGTSVRLAQSTNAPPRSVRVEAKLVTAVKPEAPRLLVQVRMNVPNEMTPHTEIVYVPLAA